MRYVFFYDIIHNLMDDFDKYFSHTTQICFCSFERPYIHLHISRFILVFIFTFYTLCTVIKMGGRSSRGKSLTWDFNKLAETSGLTQAEIEKFYSDYMEAAGRDGVIDKNEFIQLYGSHPVARSLSEGAIKEQATRIFRAFDVDRNGVLTFDEFLTVIVMMNCRAPEDDHVGYLIEENNDRPYLNNDKYVSKQYGLEIFRRLNDLHRLPAGTEHESWKELDEHNRGYVTHEELVDYINRKSIYS